MEWCGIVECIFKREWCRVERSRMSGVELSSCGVEYSYRAEKSLVG